MRLPMEEDGYIYGRRIRLESGASLLQDGFAAMNENASEDQKIRRVELLEDGTVLLYHQRAEPEIVPKEE